MIILFSLFVIYKVLAAEQCVCTVTFTRKAKLRTGIFGIKLCYTEPHSISLFDDPERNVRIFYHRIFLL
jgi:hypothetical protein